MQTFAVIAVRLIGIWIIAGSIAGVSVLLATLFLKPAQWADAGFAWISMVTPALAGLVLIALSKPIAAMVTAGTAGGSSPPDGVTVRGFTQMGIFLLGLFAVIRGLPYVIAALFGQMLVSIDQWIAVGLGALLMFSSVRLGNLIEPLRR